MKVNVIKDKCIGCGNCIALTGCEIFDYDDDGYATTVVDVVPNNLEETTQDAINQCPTEAIVEIQEEQN